MSQPYVGEIRLFAGDFTPEGWQLCDGTLLQIAEYVVLFQLIGTTYGGDGITTFAVPDLRGRVPVHFGTGPAPASHSYTLGEQFGSDAPGTAAELPTGFTVSRGLAATVTATGNADNDASNDNRVGINFIIALFGIFPTEG
jgi:microcystin-dependent protein